MAFIHTKKQRLSNSQTAEVHRELTRNSPLYDPNLRLDKPIFCEDKCSFINDAYRAGYERIFGRQDISRNLVR